MGAAEHDINWGDLLRALLCSCTEYDRSQWRLNFCYAISVQPFHVPQRPMVLRNALSLGKIQHDVSR